MYGDYQLKTKTIKSIKYFGSRMFYKYQVKLQSFIKKLELNMLT